MKKLLLPVLLLLAATLLVLHFLFVDYNHANETVYFGGPILTMSDAQPRVEALYVKNGKILAAGTKAEVMQAKSRRATLTDLQGKTLLPGFFDAHGHLDLATALYGMTDISGFTHRTPEGVWNAVAQKVKATPKGEWIFCLGYDPILTKGLEPPSTAFLDSLAPDHPVALIAQTMHSYYANSKAFQAAGITAQTPDPSSSSYYGRDSSGQLTGLIVEQAAFEPFRAIMQENLMDSFVENTHKVLAKNAQKGITSTVTMGLMTVNKNILMLYQDLSGEKVKPLHNLIRITGAFPERKPNLRHFVFLMERFSGYLPKPKNRGDDFFRFMGVKLWYDGSPYIGSMYMSRPYLASRYNLEAIHLPPGHRGEALIQPEQLEAAIRKYQSDGWQVAIHCQGDRAIAEALGAFGRVHQEAPLNARRHRLEHLLMLPYDQIATMQEMGISPSFHINHILYYGDFLQSDILGPERTQQLLPVNQFAAKQIPFSLHADQPMYEADPLSLASTAVNRQSESGLAINPAEAVSVWEALKSITIYAAWQLKMEAKLGTLEKGKYADLVVLDKNPLETPAEAIARIQVLETIVAGNTVWKK